MRLDFLTERRESRLILIFSGWSTSVDQYRDCVFSGWDTAIVSDYRDLSTLDIPSHYKTVYIFAYSLGVFAASIHKIDAAVKVAICGTGYPISDRFGIPKAIFRGTAENLSVRNLAKFHRRMAGSRLKYEQMLTSLPMNPDIDALREELLSIDRYRNFENPDRWHRAYIASDDAIFPPDNQRNYWYEFCCTDVVEINSPHAVDIASIIKSVLPDPETIGRSFEEALPCYKDSAIVQSEVCERIGELLKSHYDTEANGTSCAVGSVLEMGPGCGMLTDIWRKYVTPSKATFIDLYRLIPFEVAPVERYLTEDAERWLEESNETFDLIVSASVLQWFTDPLGFIRRLRFHLRPGGVAIISTYVYGNLAQLDALRPSPIIYHLEQEYRKSAPDNTKIVTWSRDINFENRKELLMHLRRTGVAGSTLPTSIPLMSYPTSLTYRPLIVVIKA